jgi:hypothetical protein
MLRRIFRAPHGFLLLATLLSLALLFAPVAYAANFTTNAYAQLFGTWAQVEHTLQPGPGHWTTYTCLEDPLHLLYATAAAATLLFLLYSLLLGGNDERRIRLCSWGALFVLVQIGASLLLLLHVPSYVGGALPDDLERSLNREWAFHLFALLFVLNARRRYRLAVGKRLERAAKGETIDAATA